MTTLSIAFVLERLGNPPDPQHAKCPCHEDDTGSLAVWVKNRWINVKCHAACKPDDILTALGLTKSDLGPGSNGRGRVVGVYDYPDVKGRLAFQVVRFEDKAFRQRHWNGDGKVVWNLKGVDPILFRGPRVVEAVKRGWPIHLVEGEKDVRALERYFLEKKITAVATCNPGGAEKWKAAYTEMLTGAADLTIIADNDLPGRKHATHRYADLKPVVTSVRVVLPAVDDEHADVSDHLAAEYQLDDLVPMDVEEHRTAPVVDDGSHAATTRADGQPVVDTDHRGLTDVEVMALEDPTWLIEGLLPERGIGVLFGQFGTGKTFLALDLGKSIVYGRSWNGRKVLNPGAVIYVLAEGQGGWKSRLAAWHEAYDKPFDVTGFRSVLEPVDLMDAAAVAKLGEDFEDLNPVLWIFDTLTQNTAGADENSAADMGLVLNNLRLLSPNSFKLLLHHPGHSESGRARGWSGLAQNIETYLKLSPDKGEDKLPAPSVFSSVLSCPKQKDAAPFKPIRLSFEQRGPSLLCRPTDSVVVSSDLREEVENLIDDDSNREGLTNRTIADQLNVTTTDVRRVAEKLEKDGRIISKHRGPSTKGKEKRWIANPDKRF